MAKLTPHSNYPNPKKARPTRIRPQRRMTHHLKYDPFQRLGDNFGNQCIYECTRFKSLPTWNYIIRTILPNILNSNALLSMLQSVVITTILEIKERSGQRDYYFNITWWAYAQQIKGTDEFINAQRLIKIIMSHFMIELPHTRIEMLQKSHNNALFHSNWNHYLSNSANIQK